MNAKTKLTEIDCDSTLEMCSEKHYTGLLEANKSNHKKTWKYIEGKLLRIQEKLKLSEDSVTTD